MTHEPVTLTIERLAHGGEGVAHLEDGRVVFVTGALPGEQVVAHVGALKKTWARASVDEILEPSPLRIDPACPHASKCGGCDLWHLDPSHEATLKAKAAAETIARLSRLELPEHVAHAAPEHTGYRVRATFRLRRVGEKLLVGYIERGGRRVVDIGSCAVLDPTLELAREALRAAPVRSAVVFAELAGPGEVVYSFTEVSGARVEAFEAWLESMCEGKLVRGARATVGKLRMRVGRPEVDAALAVPALPSLSPIRTAPAGMFRQANPAVNHALVSHVRASLSTDAPFEHLLELFGGAGNLTFAVPDLAKRVTTIEGEGAASKLAKQIAASHATHVTALARTIDASLVDELVALAPDALLLDPPRSGARDVCAALGALESLRHITYVSCDPACLGRDLAALGELGWRVRSLELFDMFPRTAHIESVAVLERA